MKRRQMDLRKVWGWFAGALLAWGMFTGLPARGDGFVIVPFTEAALDEALLGGGTVEILADGVITFTGTKTISVNTIVDANGYDVTFNGSNAVRLFHVNTNVTLTLINLKLVNGRSTNGAAIFNNGGTVLATNCEFAFHQAVAANGGNGAAGNGNETGDTGKVGRNGLGGAICNLGTATFSQCRFRTNSATGGSMPKSATWRMSASASGGPSMRMQSGWKSASRFRPA